MENIPTYRILLFGEYGIGKTHFKNYYTYGKFVDSTIVGTGCGDQMSIKYVEKNNHKVKLQIWDPLCIRLHNITEGNNLLIPLYFREITGAIIMFDLTSRETFELTKDWSEEIKKKSLYEVSIVLVGNKSDLKSQVVISKEEAEDMAEEIGAKYFESSAKDGVNVKEVFEYLALTMKTEEEYKAVQTVQNDPQQKSGYCW